MAFSCLAPLFFYYIHNCFKMYLKYSHRLPIHMHLCLIFSQFTECSCLPILFLEAGKSANTEWKEQVYQQVITTVAFLYYLFLLLPSFVCFFLSLKSICLHIVCIYLSNSTKVRYKGYIHFVKLYIDYTLLPLLQPQVY